MSLHDDIMNLPAKLAISANASPEFAYKCGHKEARHAAAELALKADAESERLRVDTSTLAERLRNAASAGYDEWRVQDPKDGAYCIAYSWPETMNPEREARAWLADQQQRYPNGLYADYVVACVRVVPQKDRLLAEAADELDRLAGELREGDDLRERLSDILRRTAVALRGPEPPLTRWSWHDLPELAAAAVAAAPSPSQEQG